MWRDINKEKPDEGQYCLVWDNQDCGPRYVKYESEDRETPAWVEGAQAEWEVKVDQTYDTYIEGQEGVCHELVFRHWMPAPPCPYGDSHYKWQPVERYCGDRYGS